MKCPLCRVELRILKSRIVLENDDTPDEDTKVFREQDLTCTNKQCTNFEKIVETVRNEITVN
jgi:hypothetical protein